MSLLCIELGYTVKYGFSPQETPSGSPSCSGYISPYIPPLVIQSPFVLFVCFKMSLDLGKYIFALLTSAPRENLLCGYVQLSNKGLGIKHAIHT